MPRLLVEIDGLSDIGTTTRRHFLSSAFRLVLPSLPHNFFVRFAGGGYLGDHRFLLAARIKCHLGDRLVIEA